MIVLTANDITKEYGTDIILENVSFHVNKGDRIGIVGLNGAGKTTLLKIISGELPAEKGNIFISGDTTVGYLKQSDNFDSQNTVIEEVYSVFEKLTSLEKQIEEMNQHIAEISETQSPEEIEEYLHRYDRLQEEYKNQGGFTYKGEIKGVLNSMAFSEDFYDKYISTLSGGEKTRLAMACLLLRKPDILLLDEPTNHLDIDTLKWLEQYLRAYSGTIIIISHDRYFLDQTVNRIFEISNHKLHAYNGNYSEYAVKRKERRDTEMRQYENQQKEIKRQEEMIRRFKGRGTEKLAKRAQSREKRLEKIERVEKPDADMGKMKLRFKENFESGKDVIFAENLSKGFGYGRNRKELFDGVNLDIKRGEKICIVGPNGVGKTTLLKILVGELAADSGRLKEGYNVEFAYYDQEQEHLGMSNTVMDEIHDSHRLYTETEVRSILGRFLFRNEDVFLPVASLSGGEKARLSLVKLMLLGANVLVLDEPTNHLDIDSKEVFEEALRDFAGTVIVVSHDRYFLNKIPTRILELNEHGVTEYLGKYDYYMEKKQAAGNTAGSEDAAGRTASSGAASKAAQAGGNTSDTEAGTSQISAQEQRRLKKEQEASERRMRRKQEKLESEISDLESAISDLEAQMCLPENIRDHVKLTAISGQCDEKKARLEEVYDEWLMIQEEE